MTPAVASNILEAHRINRLNKIAKERARGIKASRESIRINGEIVSALEVALTILRKENQ